MKTLLKKFILVSIATAGVFSLPINIEVSAAGNIVEVCDYTAKGNVNPDLSTMNCLLTETALMYDVPPEIVKAIAEGESSDWSQFDENGDAVVTSDNGIGVMQVTNQANYDQEKLKNDVVYNINAGVEILSNMFERNDLPTINGAERDVLEHWYFAIMAYNGIKPVNSPIIKATGQPNDEAYQEKVFNIIEELGLVDTVSIPFSSEDFEYDSNSSDNITFLTMQYDFNLAFTKSKHLFKKNQPVRTTAEIRLRTGPTTDSASMGTLNNGEALTVIGSFKYDEVITRKNHFVWYPVERADGTTGYVASSYLKYKFRDVPAGHYAEDGIYYLADRNLLFGIGNNNFGLNQALTRWQAVLLITRANDVSLGNRQDPGFVDVPKDYPYYDAIAAAVEEGLFGGKSDTIFEPEATLTRREMAVVLQRLYQFPVASTSYPFTDIHADDWYADAVARLYQAGITGGITATQYGPKIEVTREQFAVFMTRSIDEQYRLN